MNKTDVSIWFFNGVMLTIYGLMIGSYGIYELASGNLPHVVLARLHAPLWWGGGLLALGLFYCMKFLPGREKNTGGKQ